MRTRLEALGDALGYRLDADMLARLMILRGLWLAQGRAINLTGAGTDEELLVHIGDGIATVICAARMPARDPGTAALSAETWWLDVGAGGGLPGLIVAAITPANLVLVEPRQRRASFLEFALASIGNKSQVIRARIGDTTWDEYCLGRKISPGNEMFSVVTARAVFAPEKWLEVGEKLVMRGGAVIAHLRPGQNELAGVPATVAVEWGASRICGFLSPVGGANAPSDANR